ncbi:MAG TPA: redox-sensing transcriptional repressor Rex [Solirubrobacteraceae bacterium]|nr:redox-sensing transcriptional repressor Rex [Solirubrobacteraceae bacterium]
MTLYGRPGCHLCDEARAVLERVRADLRFTLVERDIESDERLLRAYLERIPVVSIDGEELFSFAVDERALRARLAARRDHLESEPMSLGELTSHGDGGLPPGDRLPLGIAARLSRYLQILTQARKMGRETISSQELATYTHVNSTQIRRDLSGFGKFGKRGVGYNVDSLVAQIRKILRTAGQHNIALFGAGHLGRAIASSEIFADHGFRVVAIFDRDPVKVGETIGSLDVRHNDELRAVVEDQEIVVGVLAVPGHAAQSLADDLVAAGVKIIFNYSDALLNVPPETTVHTSSPAVDLLYALYFYLA